MCIPRHRIWLDEEVTGRNEVTTTFCYVWPLWCACPFSGCEWASCHGTLLCEFSLPRSGESWEEMTNIEPRNKMLYSPRSDQWPGRPVISVAEFRIQSLQIPCRNKYLSGLNHYSINLKNIIAVTGPITVLQDCNCNCNSNYSVPLCTQKSRQRHKKTFVNDLKKQKLSLTIRGLRFPQPQTRAWLT